MARRIEFLDIRKIKTAGFQGECGAFSEQAARRFFKRKLSILPAPTFEEVFKAVAKKKADAGIVPIENSLQGSIHENYDLLQRFHLFIVGEVKLRIVHHLLGVHKSSMRTIRSVYSHPQALAQCGLFLRNLRTVELIPWYDTAGAARMVSERKDRTAAAIASAEAAKAYGLKIFRRGIENNQANYTRFLILSRLPAETARGAKTSIIFSVKNTPGSLFKALQPFAQRGINLFKIESRPVIGKPWEYLFYLDCAGSIHGIVCSDALKELTRMATYVKFLGSYPQG